MKRINLLPQHKQVELYYEDLYHSVNALVALSAVILLLGVVVQVGVWVYLDRKEARLVVEVTELQQVINKSENAEVKQEIKDINAQMTDFDKLTTSSPQWSKVLKAFAGLVPNGVLINNFISDSESQEVEISGYSPTREQVIELYNNINASKEYFKDINYPLENVAKPTDVTFNFKFYIQDGILTPTE